MSMQFQFNSLKTRLTFWLLTVTMLSLTSVVTIVYFQRASFIHQREFEKLQVVRDLKVSTLNLWLEDRMGDLGVASKDNDISRFTEDLMYNADELDPEVRSTASAQLNRFGDHYAAYSELFIVSAASSKVVLSTNPTHEGSDRKSDLYFTEPMRTHKPYIKDIYYSETEKRPGMTFSAPIFGQTHGGEHPVGVLVARVDLEHALYPLLQDRTGMGDTGETLIVNKNGVALNALRWQENAVLKLKISAEPAVKGAAGETGIVETGDYRGEQVLAAYTHIPQTGWGFVAKRDLLEIYTPIRAMLRGMVFAATAIILFVIAASLWIARSITRPIVAATDATARMADGEFGIRTDSHSSDEIGQLATSFNKMAERLEVARNEAEDLNWIQAGMVEVGNATSGEKDLSALSHDILTCLARYLDVQVGTVSILDHDQLKLTGSYAYQGPAGTERSFRIGEGLVGQAAQEKKRILITDIPKESITISSALGEIPPTNIVCVPAVYEREVNGVIELGALHPFTDRHLELLDRVAEPIALAIHTAQSREQIQTLLEESQAQSEELQTQQEELKVSNEELEEKNTELEALQDEQNEEGS